MDCGKTAGNKLYFSLIPLLNQNFYQKKKRKFKFYEVLVKPTALYTCEGVIINKDRQEIANNK